MSSKICGAVTIVAFSKYMSTGGAVCILCELMCGPYYGITSYTERDHVCY